MKYGVKFGSGNYVFEGRQVSVYAFSSSRSLRSWLVEKPMARCEISVKKYVTSIRTGRNVSVRAAAISPDDEVAEEEAALVPIEMEGKSVNRLQR